MKQLRNYVVWYPQTNRIKVGVTSNFKERLKYYRQESARHDLGYVGGESLAPLHAGLARCIEADICRALKSCAIPGHREWFLGDGNTYIAFVEMTKRMHAELTAVMNGDVEHA